MISNHDQQNAMIDPAKIQQAMAKGVYHALRRHMLLGESVAAAGDYGEVKILGPEEIRQALEEWDNEIEN